MTAPTPTIGTIQHETAASAFTDKVRECLDDPRIAGYFKRKLVPRDGVIDALVDGDALVQAVQMSAYGQFADSHAQLRSKLRRNSEIIASDAMNSRTIVVYIGISIIVAIWFIALIEAQFLTLGIISTSTVFAGIAGWLFALANIGPDHRFRRITFSLIAMVISVVAIILPHLLGNIPWDPYSLFAVWGIALLIFYLLPNHGTAYQCAELLVLAWNRCAIPLIKHDITRFQNAWLEECAEDIIMQEAVLAINTILGEDKDRFLVEQNSEGLRKLQDPSFTVTTQSELRIASVLSQMDGGSIALAGPRGAGKSTLLRKFSGPLRTELRNTPCSVYLTAPAEYVPRDFIAELLQQLCETYLEVVGRPLPGPIYKERPRFSLRRALVRMLSVLWFCVRTAISIAVIVWILHLHIKINYSHMYASLLTNLKHWYDNVSQYTYKHLHKRFKRYWTLVRIAVALIALFFLPRWRRWKEYIRPRKEPALAKKARECLHRLRIDKTVSWGATVSSPTMRTVGIGVTRGGTASYTPWTLPELVGQTRSFMKEIAETFKLSTYAVVIGIDEIDRIGSLDHAERFIGEIKAVFGVEKCFFLVAVAEDVGSIFAQRAFAGRSILENAFDDIVVAEPLNLQETADLLLKRVPGFTDSFVYLVHALSGGLPRELIRVTRQLVEINAELNRYNRRPKLEDLAFALVREELVEAIRATRNQMSRLTLHANWAALFEKLRAASANLRHTSSASAYQMYELIEELSDLKVPEEAHEAQNSGRALVVEDEDTARRVIGDFVAYAYFGLTVIDAFSDKYFDLRAVQQRTMLRSEDSYEELAVARAELTVSPENSRAIVYRFRSSLSSN